MLQGAYNEGRSEEARLAVSIELPGPELAPLLEFAATRGVYIASSAVERRRELPGWFFHSGFLIGPGGLLIRYPKAQARSAAGVKIIQAHYAEYTAMFGEDAVFPVAETPIGNLAMCVEAEILVPEVARAFAAKGAEVLLHPTVELATAHPWMYDPARQARALENRMYVLSANLGVARERHPATGEQRERTSRGGSGIAGPDGQMLTHIAGPGEAMATARIDIGALRELRATPARETFYSPILYRSLYGAS
jgi:predicted amidohydrolase